MSTEWRTSVPIGFVIGIASIAYALAYAALIFSGSGLGEPELAYGIGAALISTAVAAVIVSALSAFPFGIGAPDSNAAAILAAIVANVAPFVVLDDTRVQVVNILAVLMFSSAILGLVLFVLGRVNAGRWIRYVPLPVIGGFLAAAGLLILRGAARVAAGAPIDFAHASDLFASQDGLKLLAAILFAVVLTAARMRIKGPLVLPATLALGTLATLVVLGLAHVPLGTARLEGWLFSAPSGPAMWFPWNPADLRLIEWDTLTADIPGIITLVIVSAVTLLLTSTGLELRTRMEIDLDRELRVQGMTSLITAACGGFASYLSLSRTAMNYELGVRDRLAGPIVAVVAMAFAFGGIALVGFIPKFVLCGLLFVTGGSLLYEWVVKSYAKLTLAEYSVVLIILAIIIGWGFIAGLVCGLIVGTIFFALSYAQVDVIKQEFTGRNFSSNLQRSPDDTHQLRQQGDRTRIIFLQGFIFFGMAHRLYRRVRTDTLEDDNGQAEFVIIDFGGVPGIDSSGATSFLKLLRAAKDRGSTLVFTRMKPPVLRSWRAAAGSEGREVHLFDDLDTALEWTESQLLRTAGHHAPPREIEAWLAERMHNADLAHAFVGYLRERTVGEGEILCRQGETADSMFLIGHGRIGIYLDDPDGRHIRLRSLGSFTFLGEMGLYQQSTRSASAIAEEESVMHVLTSDAFETILRNEPALAAAVDGLIVMTLSERISYGNALIAALSK